MGPDNYTKVTMFNPHTQQTINGDQPYIKGLREYTDKTLMNKSGVSLIDQTRQNNMRKNKVIYDLQ